MKGKPFVCMLVNTIEMEIMVFLLLFPLAPWGLNRFVPEGYEYSPWVQGLAFVFWVIYYLVIVMALMKSFLRAGKAFSILIGSKRMAKFFASGLKNFQM